MENYIMDICLAIKNRQYIEFKYDGHPRRVVPFATGSHATTGTPVMRGLQVAGSSASGKFDFPKLFELGKMTDFKILDEHFEMPERFEEGDDHIDPIECEL